MTSEYLMSEVKPPEEFEPRKYRVSYRCRECGHTWKSRWLKATPKDDPPCPNPSCAELRAGRQAMVENQRLRAMLESQRGPAQIGDKPIVKAVDFTAETTMQSYGMTDLKDNIREGESMAPKLPGQAQAQADNYFAGEKAQGPSRMMDLGTGRMRTVQADKLNLIAKRAMQGAYRHRAVSPVEVIPKNMQNQSPLSLVRTEKNPHFKG